MRYPSPVSWVICCCCSLSAEENLYCDFHMYGELRTILRKEANNEICSTDGAALHCLSSIVDIADSCDTNNNSFFNEWGNNKSSCEWQHWHPVSVFTLCFKSLTVYCHIGCRNYCCFQERTENERHSTDFNRLCGVMNGSGVPSRETIVHQTSINIINSTSAGSTSW
jgi:hypothetical protein